VKVKWGNREEKWRTLRGERDNNHIGKKGGGSHDGEKAHSPRKKGPCSRKANPCVGEAKDLEYKGKGGGGERGRRRTVPSGKNTIAWPRSGVMKEPGRIGRRKQMSLHGKRSSPLEKKKKRGSFFK